MNQPKQSYLNILLLILTESVLASEALVIEPSFGHLLTDLSSATSGRWPAEAFYLPDPCE